MFVLVSPSGEGWEILDDEFWILNERGRMDDSLILWDLGGLGPYIL